MIKFQKNKSGPNQAGPKYRTPDHFRESSAAFRKTPAAKFNPARFKIQHKG